MKPLEYLRYEPETGNFYWLVRRGPRAAGAIAGGLSALGYWTIYAGGKLCYAHRLAWYAMHGHFPALEIDHINGIRSDNRIINLRTATRAQNAANVPRHRDGASGIKGAYYSKRDKYWYSAVRSRDVHKRLGPFNSADEAHAAYVATAKQLHGEFFRPTNKE